MMYRLWLNASIWFVSFIIAGGQEHNQQAELKLVPPYPPSCLTLGGSVKLVIEYKSEVIAKNRDPNYDWSQFEVFFVDKTIAVISVDQNLNPTSNFDSPYKYRVQHKFTDLTTLIPSPDEKALHYRLEINVNKLRSIENGAKIYASRSGANGRELLTTSYTTMNIKHCYVTATYQTEAENCYFGCKAVVTCVNMENETITNEAICGEGCTYDKLPCCEYECPELYSDDSGLGTIFLYFGLSVGILLALGAGGFFFCYKRNEAQRLTRNAKKASNVAREPLPEPTAPPRTLPPTMPQELNADKKTSHANRMSTKLSTAI